MSQPHQQRLEDYHQPDWRRTNASPRHNGYGWTPSGDTDRTLHDHPKDCCQNCGEPVDAPVRRVFGDNDDVMWECPSCPNMNREGLTEFANTAGTGRQTKQPEGRRTDK